MNVNQLLAIFMVFVASFLMLLAIALLIFIPFATEIEDVLGPLIGGVICFISAAALVLDSNEFIKYKVLPGVSKIVLHLVNVVAIVLVCSLVIPNLLEDAVYSWETRILIFVGLTVAISYVLAAKMRHTGRPCF